MNIELRLQKAVSSLEDSVGERKPRILPSSRRVMFVRVALAALMIGLTALVAIPAIRNSSITKVNTADQPGKRDDGGSQVDTDPAPTQGGSGSVPAPGTDQGKSGTAPGNAGSGSGSRESLPEGTTGDVSCDPLITDRKGDVQGASSNNPAIDILEASMTYDASRNTLVVREVFDDIPTNPPGSNEALAYSFYFTHDGVEYRTLAYFGAASSDQVVPDEWYFAVDRGDRTTAGEKAARWTVMQATGRVDTQADTVTIQIDVDEFNRGERRVSDQEGLPPAAELRRGSTLTNVHLFSHNASFTPTQRDEAHGCQYVVPES